MDINKELGSIIKDEGIIKFVDLGEGALSGKGVLAVEKLDAFIKEMKDATVLLDAARIIPMNSYEKDIDRFGMDGELAPLTRNATTGVITRNNIDADFKVNTLHAKKLGAATALTRETVEDNIEGGAIEGTITSAFGETGGKSLEREFIFGDTASETATDGYKIIDGWAKKAGVKLYGLAATTPVKAADFDPSSTNVSSDKYVFSAMLDACDTAYLEGACFFVPTSIARTYQRTLKAKNSNLGDQANLTKGELTFEGYPVIAVPALDKPYKDESFFADPVMFFGQPQVFVYGLYKEVEIRPFEDIPNDIFNFYLRLRADCHFENEDAVVAAFPATVAV